MKYAHYLAVTSLLAMMLSVISSCASNELENTKPLVGWTKLFDQYSLTRNSRWAIDQNVAFYIVLPTDNRMDESLHESLTGIFQRYYPNTRAGLYREPLPSSFVSAQRAGVDFLVFPRILHRSSPVDIGRLFRREVKVTDLARGRFDMDIMIYATNGEQLVDLVQFTSVGAISRLDETSVAWQPLDAYLKQLSQYGNN